MFINEIVLILNSLTINYPIMVAMGIFQDVPIALVCDNTATTRKIAEVISPAPVVVDPFTDILELHNKMDGICSQGVFCLLAPGIVKVQKREKAIVDAMISLAAYGRVNQTLAVAPTYFLLTKSVPYYIEKNSLVIKVEGNLDDIETELFKYLPSAEDITFIKETVKAFDVDEYLPLKAAAAFMLPKLNHYGECEMYSELLKTCEFLIESDKFFKSDVNLVEFVQSCLLDCIKNHQEQKLILPNLDADGEKRFDTALFYNRDYIYLSDKKFKQVFEKLCVKWGVNTLKEKMLNAGLLKADKGSFTTKMQYKCNGETKSQRMHCIHLYEVETVATSLI